MEEKQLAELGQEVPRIFEERRQDSEGEVHAVGITTIEEGVEAGHVALAFFLKPGSSYRIQKELQEKIAGREVKIPTVRLEEQPFAFQYCNCFKERPARGGNCISAAGSSSLGTLGGMIISPSNDAHLISAGHVLDNFGQYPPGRYILQPASGDRFATLTRTVPWAPVMQSDAGIAEVLDPAWISDYISDIGKQGDPIAPALNVSVKKSGAATCLTASTIRYIAVTIQLSVDGQTMQFRDLFLTASKISDQGDSGALIVDYERGIRGVVICANPQHTAACNIMNVIADLQLQGWRWHT